MSETVTSGGSAVPECQYVVTQPFGGYVVGQVLTSAPPNPAFAVRVAMPAATGGTTTSSGS